MAGRGEVLSTEVINYIEEKKAKGFSEKEKREISDMMKDLSEGELEKVKIHIQSKIAESSKGDLLSLAERIESFQNLPYGLEGIDQSTNSEVFKKILPLFKIWLSVGSLGEKGALSESKIKTVLGNDAESLGESEKSTIELVVWSRLTKSLNIPNVVQVQMDSFFGKITDSVKGVGDMFEKTQGAEDTDPLNSITSVLDDFETLENPLDEMEKQDALGGIQEFINNLLKKDFENLKRFNDLINTNNISAIDKAGLLSNPIVLDSVLEFGLYKSDTIDIDLESDRLNLEGSQSESDIQAAQAEFMSTAAEFSDAKGTEIEGKVNKAKEYLEKLMGIADKMGLTSESLDSIKEKLFKLPIIGFFFKLMLGGFFENMGTKLESLGLTDERKKSSTELLTFLSSDTQMKLGDTSVVVDLGEDTFNATSLKDFYNTVEKTNESDEEGDKSEKLYKKSTFWNELLTGEDISDPYMISIRNQIIENITNKQNGGTISKDDFIEALNTIKVLEVQPVVDNVEEPVNSVVPDASLTGDKSQVNNVDGSIDQNATIASAVLLAGAALSTNDNQKADVSQSGGDLDTGTANDTQLGLINGELDSQAEERIISDPASLQEVVDQQTSKTIAEQLVGVNSFPFDLEIDGETLEVDFDDTTKKIKIGDASYGITQMWKGDTSLMDSFTLGGLDFDTSGLQLSLIANTRGKFFIKAANLINGFNSEGDTILTGQEENILPYDLSRDVFSDLIQGLVANEEYEYGEGNKDGIKLVIS